MKGFTFDHVTHYGTIGNQRTHAAIRSERAACIKTAAPGLPS